MADEHEVMAGAKTLVRGVRLIHRDIVKPGVRGLVNSGKKALAKRKKKKEEREELDF